MLKFILQKRKCGLHNAVVFIGLFTIIIINQSPFLSKAESDFEEYLYIGIDFSDELPTYADITFQIDLFSIKEISNYTTIFVGENYKYIEANWDFQWYNSTFSVTVYFDSSSLENIEEGKTIADRIIQRAEHAWNFTLSYEGYRVILTGIQGIESNETCYVYRPEEPFPLRS